MTRAPGLSSPTGSIEIKIYIAHCVTSNNNKTEFIVYLHWMLDAYLVEHKHANRQAPVPEYKERIALGEKKHTKMM
jgi:hypothetical protein